MCRFTAQAFWLFAPCLSFVLAASKRVVCSQPLLATYWANWNAFGSPLCFFVSLCVVAAFIVSPLSPLAGVPKRRVLLALPGFMFIGCLFTRWVNSRSATFLDWYFYKFYYAGLDTSFIVSLAFGVAFTLDALRAPDRLCRIVGWCYVPLYLWLLAESLRYIRSWYVN